MTVVSIINEFERRLNKAKTHGCELSSSVLAFFLLNQAQLSVENKKLIRATVSKLDFAEMKKKMTKVFGSNLKVEEISDVKVKIEDLNIAENEEEIMFGNYRGGNCARGNGRYQRGTFSNRGAFRGQFRGNQNFKGNSSFRGNPKSKSYADYNDRKIKRSRCHVCGSYYHYASECPDKIYFGEAEDEEEPEYEYDVVLYQSNLVTEKEFEIFVAESSSSAILDCGASATVSGINWFNSHFQGLSEEKQREVQYCESNSYFKFGTGEKFKSKFKVIFPATIGSNDVMIQSDVVETNVPLLLSLKSMKNAQTEINYVTDTVKMFGQEQKIHFTQCGHYAIPLNNSKSIIEDLEKFRSTKITLFTADETNKRKIALKLHAQFGHPSKCKLVKLLERAGCGSDKELM